MPASAYAEEEGSATNSSRVIMWHWKAVEGPGESKSDIEIVSALRGRLTALYAKEGGALVPTIAFGVPGSAGMAVLISPASSMKRVFCPYSRAFHVK